MAFVVLIAPLEVDPQVETVSSKVRMPRYGILTVASHLKAHGHTVRVFDEFVGATVDWTVVAEAEVVCFGVMSFCSLRAYAMADQARELGKPVIFGGSHPSVLPEESLEHADFAVRNEGEATLLDLLDALAAKRSIATVAGLSWRNEHGKVIHNPDRPFMSDLSVPMDLSLLPEYRPWSLLPSITDAVSRGFPRFPMPVLQATRGCPFRCRFCFVKNELGTKYRKRPIELILDEIGAYRQLFGNPYVLFADNDLTLDEDFSHDLFSRILERFGPRFRPWLFSRLSVSGSPSLLALLNRFEHVILGLGIESIDDSELKNMKKGQTVRQIENSLSIVRRYPNLHVNGQFLFGGDDETPDSIRKAYDFGLKHGLYNLGMAIQYDFPGRNAVLGQDQFIADNHFIHRDWRFYGGNFVVYFPASMRPSELQRTMLETFNRYYEQRTVFRQLQSTRPTVLKYIEYLEGVEKPYYDAHGRRLDQRLEGVCQESLAAHVPIQLPRAARYKESARYVAGNLTRKVAWSFAWSKLRPMQRDSSYPTGAVSGAGLSVLPRAQGLTE